MEKHTLEMELKNLRASLGQLEKRPVYGTVSRARKKSGPWWRKPLIILLYALQLVASESPKGETACMSTFGVNPNLRNAPGNTASFSVWSTTHSVFDAIRISVRDVS
jgi:hypothetical protein